MKMRLEKEFLEYIQSKKYNEVRKCTFDLKKINCDALLDVIDNNGDLNRYFTEIADRYLNQMSRIKIHDLPIDKCIYENLSCKISIDELVDNQMNEYEYFPSLYNPNTGIFTPLNLEERKKWINTEIIIHEWKVENNMLEITYYAMESYLYDTWEFELIVQIKSKEQKIYSSAKELPIVKKDFNNFLEYAPYVCLTKIV